MAKTYFEKLKDPRWQKKRLESLEKASWSCSACGGTEDTLHVHHKQYFKGREPWEYETGQLEVLCEKCHEEAHDEKDLLLIATSFVDANGADSRTSVASLVAGYCGHGLDKEHARQDPDSYIAGQLAKAISSWRTGNLLIGERIRLVELAKNDLDGLTKALRAYMESKE